MIKYYITFGQKSPFRDGYVIVEAPDATTARYEVFYAMGDQWGFMYTEEEIDFDLFPLGQIGRTLRREYPVTMEQWKKELNE